MRKMQKGLKPEEEGEKADEPRWLNRGKVAAAGGSTEARRKVEYSCTEVRNREEVPAFM